MRKISLPLIPESEKKRVLVWGAMAFIFVYVVLGECPLGEPAYLPLTTIDRFIPLLPWTLIIYLSDYLFVLFALLSAKNAEEFSYTYYRMIAGILMSFAVFIIFPTAYPRPPTPTGFWSEFYGYLHLVDLPTNCFPSLHVSITLISAVSLATARPVVRWGCYLWAAAICLSTLTTKQHYVLDVLGGIFVTMASVWLTSRIACLSLAKNRVQSGS